MSANVLFSGDGWRMLTSEEITYLITERTDASNLQGYATVNEIIGIILLPDDWVLPQGLTFKPKATTGYTANVYNLSQWELMENAGAVFLPCGGFRNTPNGVIGNLSNGYYLSSSLSSTNVYHLFLQNNAIQKNINFPTFYGGNVRLIKNSETGHNFSISSDEKVLFANGNLQYQASTNTWRFAENQYDVIRENNYHISPTTSNWIDLFGWGTTGWENGRISAQPYSISTTATDYCISNQSAVGVMKYQDFGIYLCYLRDRQSLGQFAWCRNPTAINKIATLYVSKRGSDVDGDGSKDYPYASLAMVTNAAVADTNIVIDDGEWNELVTNNPKRFNFWGNANVIFNTNPFPQPNTTENVCHYIKFINKTYATKTLTFRKSYNCLFYLMIPACNNNAGFYHENSIFIYSSTGKGGYEAGLSDVIKNCIFIFGDCGGYGSGRACCYNSIFLKTSKTSYNYGVFQYCNFIDSPLPTTQNSIKNINNETENQTLFDYFNYLTQSIITNPNTANYDDWLKCDFTAKEGSANIGAGEKGSTIGLNQGYTMYADNSTNDMFSPSNGATLKNIAWDSTLNGYVLVQKERICQGATSTTITLDSSAIAVDGYYNNLFVGIVGGDGYGELFLINDYDGATKTATIDGTWATTPTTNSIYTISGTILSAVKDFGKEIKVKRNWTFADNFTALTDGQWAEFLTHVETSGKQFPVSCYSYEYSTDGVNFVQGQTADDLVSATNGENKVTDNIYGDCSPNYDEATAKNLIMRYIRVRVHIGFNIGQIGE